MSDQNQIDEIDINILKHLLNDARKPFQEVAKDLIVSGGTIHVRFNKLKDSGIVQGSKIKVDFEKLGLNASAFVGVNLRSAKDYKNALDQLNKLQEVTEAHYTTGQYSMFIKVVTKDIKSLHLFLIEKLQSIPEIQSTETLICLDNPIQREPSLSLD